MVTGVNQVIDTVGAAQGQWLPMNAAPARRHHLPSTRIVACALALALLPTAHAIELRGFRGMMWGDPPTHLGAARRVSAQAGVQCYEREQENLLFGDVPLRWVRYCFHRDALYLVQLSAVGQDDGLRTEFERGYGVPGGGGAASPRWGDPQHDVSAEIAGAAGAAAVLQLRSHRHAPSR